MTNTKKSTAKGRYLAELRSGSRAQPIPSKKVRKERSRSGRTRAAVRRSWEGN